MHEKRTCEWSHPALSERFKDVCCFGADQPSQLCRKHLPVTSVYPNQAHGLGRILLGTLAQRILSVGCLAATTLFMPGCGSGASSVETSDVQVQESSADFTAPIGSRLEVLSGRCYRLVSTASGAVINEQCIGGSAPLDDLPVNEMFSDEFLKVVILGRGWSLLGVSPQAVRVEQQGQWILFEGSDSAISTVTLGSTDVTLQCIFSVPPRCKPI